MKKALMTLGLAVLLAAPAMAGSVGVYGAWWTTEDASDSLGGGAWVDFYLGSGVEIERRGRPVGDVERVNGVGDAADWRGTAWGVGVTGSFGCGAANTLNGDGVLAPEAPSEEPVDTFLYDPRNPMPTS